MPITKQTPAEFFYENAGVSYDPRKETEEQGRRRGAKSLAKAEKLAHERGYSFHWEQDDITSAEFSDDPNPWAIWRCLVRDESGEVVGSLGGVDFGRDGEPWGDNYRRVVEAELAYEHIDD